MCIRYTTSKNNELTSRIVECVLVPCRDSTCMLESMYMRMCRNVHVCTCLEFISRRSRSNKVSFHVGKENILCKIYNEMNNKCSEIKLHLAYVSKQKSLHTISFILNGVVYIIFYRQSVHIYSVND